MEPVEPQTTEVIEEKPEPRRTRKNHWVFAGGLLVVVMLVVLVLSMQRAKKNAPSMLSVNDLTQQKYDLQEREREKNKASQLRDDPLLLRKDSESETESRLQGLMNQIDKKSGSRAESPDDNQARQEEEMIAHVMRSTPSAAAGPVSSASYQPAAPARTGSTVEGDLRASDRPMFVYSHTFGGARYVEPPRKDISAPGSIQQNEAETKPPGPPVSNPEARTGQRQPAADKSRIEKTAIIYNEHPPVTLYEGEMIDAVLLNRIVADTEPSPVISQISKDVFDPSGEYVVFPANSRIVGLSQVVNYKGAHRLFISFHRILLPHGPSVEFPGSGKALKALDGTGALGVVSSVNRHWFLQFGTALFVGVLDGLGAAAQRRGDLNSGRTLVIDETSRNFERILETIMQQYSNIVPTITVQQGKKMKIYLADDIQISPFARVSDRSYANR